MDISHEQLAARIVIRFEGYGTPYDIRIGLHDVATVGKHTVRLVQVPLQVLIDVIRGLLDRHQDIVDVLLCALQCVLCIVAGLIHQCLPREIEHDSQRQQQQQNHLYDHHQVQS